MALAYRNPVELVKGKLKTRHDRIAFAKLHYQLLREPRGLRSWHDSPRDLDRTLEGAMDLTTFFAYAESDLVGYLLSASITLEECAFYGSNLQSAGADHIVPLNARTIPYVGVRSDYQREGVGTQLLEAAVEDAQQKNASSLYALCWKGEGGASFRLFARLNFETLITFRRSLYADGSSATLVVRNLAFV